MVFILSVIQAVYVYESFQQLSDCMMEEVPAMFNVV